VNLFRYLKAGPGGVPVFAERPPLPGTKVPRHNVICGHQFVDGGLCHSYAGPDHSHPNLDDVIRDAASRIQAFNDDAFIGDVPEAAPGLMQAIAAPVPAYGELRAIYGDPADLPPILPRHQQAITDGAAAVRAAVGVAATKTDRVDFRDMLKDDGAAWSAKARLEKVLGRVYLATRLADQLDPETAAQLADRCETLVSQAVAETELRISGEVASAVTDKITQISVDRAARAKQSEEARRERFGRPSRLD